MKDTALYEQLLGLKTPWSVKAVDLSLADQRVVVEVVLKKGQGIIRDRPLIIFSKRFSWHKLTQIAIWRAFLT